MAADEHAPQTDLFLLDELLSAEERQVRGRVRDFCDTEVLPIINYYWERAEFPFALVPKLAELRVAGGALQGDGCPGMSPVAEGLVATELARADGGLRAFCIGHNMAMLSIGLMGSVEQRRRWLPKLAAMDALGAFAMTEPDHGSDVSSLGARARRDGDGYVLDGAKRWIGNGTFADVIVVWARDDDGEIGGFVVETPADGLAAVPLRGKTACRVAVHAEITLIGVRIPSGNRLTEAKSWRALTPLILRARQDVCWEALGHAIAAYEIAREHALRREQFGRPLAHFQLVQAKLAQMLANITSMQLMCWRLTRLETAGKATLPRASAAKLHTAAAARQVVLDARDILDGDGLLIDKHVARHHADVEALYTYEGTQDIQKLILGRQITGHSAFVH
ncbi:MAG: acyl-CoA dehydrogenase family protein [Actinomycetota bacterium]|nr:acyl-CoA dehydrogenase family protein [Actinomycetota bacterium]